MSFTQPRYADAAEPLRVWYAEASRATWASPNDVKTHFGNASIVGNSRVVFNIKGNEYRLIVAIDYAFHVVYVRFIGTHQQYDLVDARTI